MGAGLLVLMGALAIPVMNYKDQLEEICHYFVEHFGGLGVAMGFLVPDMVPIPFTQDIFTGMAVIGGMGFLEAVCWATAGSLIGGSIGFFIGRSLGNTPRFQRFVKGRGSRAYSLVQERGSIAVIIGAVTPIPYSVVCWSCGALDFPYSRLMWISLLRAPRIAFYLALIVYGMSWLIGLDETSLSPSGTP
jgi:membrane protein YqaA with SNARE-associated domain